MWYLESHLLFKDIDELIAKLIGLMPYGVVYYVCDIGFYCCSKTKNLVLLTRRGIGKQLLKACEDLVVKMDAKTRVYLHCRIIDEVPFNMYIKAGYNIVQTDSILVWLSLQKRKHLMRKELPQVSVGSDVQP